jgi:hypothetical protein
VLHFAFPRICSERLGQHDSFDGAFLFTTRAFFVILKGFAQLSSARPNLAFPEGNLRSQRNACTKPAQS